MENMFEFSCWYIFLLFSIYSANAVRPERDMLVSFDDDDDEYDSDLMEEDFIKPLFEPSSNSEKNKIDPKLLIKAEYDWREAEKLLMKYAYPTKRWDEVNDDEIMPVDDNNDDIFVMDGKRHVCSILIRDKNPKNNKFDPITHSLFRSKNIEIPVWETNRYETRKLLCITFPYCTWKRMHVKVIRCNCKIISETSSLTTYASIPAKRGKIKLEQMEDGDPPMQHVSVNLELFAGSSYSYPGIKKELFDPSEMPSTSKSEPNYPFGIRKSCNPLMGSLLGLGRLNEQLLGNLPGLTVGEHEPIPEKSVGLESSHERGLGTLLELMEIPEPVLDKSGRPGRAYKSANSSVGKTGWIEPAMEEAADSLLGLSDSHQSPIAGNTIQSTESSRSGTSNKGTELGESGESGKAMRPDQLPPPTTYALTSEDICIYEGIIYNHVYFSKGVSGENSFFVYGKTNEPDMLRVIAHLILPEAENNNNEEQLT